VSFDYRDLVTPTFCQKQMGDPDLFPITMGDDPIPEGLASIPMYLIFSYLRIG
jgi:hypothetical protein